VLNHGPEVKIEKVYNITQQGYQWSLNRLSIKALHRRSGHWRTVVQRDVAELQRQALKSRLEIVRKLHHPLIQQYYELYEDNKHVYISMECLEGFDIITKICAGEVHTE
jgi:serine/threonine protein kinase